MEEFHPQVVHVFVKDNDAADALSHFDIDDNAFGGLEWGPINQLLTYSDEISEQIHPLFPVALNRSLTISFGCHLI